MKLRSRQGLLSMEGGDGVELQGYLSDSESDLLLLHLHGLAGNFYENEFVHRFIARAAKRGLSFLSANTRAHDHFSDAHVARSTDALRRGAAHTKMAEICSDVGAWLRFAANRGFTKIIIQGHSAGAVAVARFLLTTSGRRGIRAAVFASPTDMVGLQLMTHGERFEELLNLATHLVAIGQGTTLMPEDTLNGYRFDAATYLDLFKPDGPADIFDFRSPEKLKRLQALAVPCLFFFGGGDEVCSVPVAQALSALENQISPHLRVTSNIVTGASHSYRGYESEMVSTVFDWIDQLDLSE